MKRNKGDKVVIKNNLEVNKKYGNWAFTSDMEKFKGKKATICYVGEDYYSLKGIYCSWTDEMLEDE